MTEEQFNDLVSRIYVALIPLNRGTPVKELVATALEYADALAQALEPMDEDDVASGV